MDLYTERGFDQTTVAEIAERAGLTERTFFRYFADKREVLFWGQGVLMELVTRHIADAPDSASPIDAVRAALPRGRCSKVDASTPNGAKRSSTPTRACRNAS